MSSSTHPFPVLDQLDMFRKLPFLFGDGIESLEVNLTDSTTGKRIVVPGRGSKCDHVDLVDVVNSTRAREAGELEWMCPVCGIEYSETSEIEVDGLMAEILGELDREDPDGVIRAINLDLDGTWSRVSDNPEERLPIRRKKRDRITLDQARQIVGGFPIDLSEDESTPPVAKKATDVIDLDDSD
jgi:hypothetical protein